MLSMNEAQTKAVQSDSKHILCLAGPGAGKTFTMIERISHLVHDKGVDPASILVLTFTNAAAFEMRERYRNRNLLERCPEFRTFHAFCYYLLSHDSAVLSKFRYSSVPSICTDAEHKAICTKAKMISGVKLSQNKLNGKEPLKMYEQEEYMIYIKAIEKLMIQKNVITFDQLCYGVCNLFVKDDICIQPYKQKYQYIFVDEFQDTDSRQWRFVQSFESSSIFLVADALQAIYGFRGADSTIVKKISTESDYDIIKLGQNYRSTKQICNYINRHSVHADNHYRIEVFSDREGPNIKLVHKGPMHPGYAEDILDLLRSFSGSTAILCRTNAEVASIQNILSDNGVEFYVNDVNTDTDHILKSLSDNKYFLDWLATLLNSDDYARYIRLSEIYEDYDIQNFYEDFKSVKSIMDKFSTIFKLRNLLKLPEVNFSEIVEEFRKLGIKDMSAVNENSTSGEILKEASKQLELSNSEKAVYVGTIHSSKGLEYDNVLVMGAGGKHFLLEGEENLNIYYVAISRAKTNLVIFRENYIPRKKKSSEYDALDF